MDDGRAEVHERWMRVALEQAAHGMEIGEVPVGAVVVLEDRPVGMAFNQPIRLGDPTGHAEILALRQAASVVGNYRLTGSTLYVTVEPCMMCAGALVHARVNTLVFGTVEPRSGAVVSNLQALALSHLNHRVEVISGVLETECRSLIQEFFRARR